MPVAARVAGVSRATTGVHNMQGIPRDFSGGIYPAIFCGIRDNLVVP